MEQPKQQIKQQISPITSGAKNSSEPLGKEIDCVCGARHRCDIRFFYEGIAKMTAIMPQGVHILYCGSDKEVITPLQRLYRTSIFDPICGTITHYSGKNCANLHENSGKNKNYIAANPEDNPTTSLSGFEDLRLVIGQGKGAEWAKNIAEKSNIGLVLMGTQGLSSFDHCKNEPENTKITPKAVFLLPLKNEECAHAFCSCINVLLSLIDWEIAALLNGARMCPHVFKEAKKTVFSLIKASKSHGKHSKALKNTLLQSQARLCVLASYIQQGLLNCSGAHQSAAALGMLFCHEQRTSMDIDTNTFLLAPYVLRLYALFLESRVAFAPPPDENLHLKRLVQFFGLNTAMATRLVGKTLSFNQIELNDYRLSLYAQPLIERIYEALDIFDDCYGLWIRLFDDDGFWVRDYLDNSDLGVCIALGADVAPAPTLLDYMRKKGVLEAFL